jgi:hypothetical protein
MIRQVYGALMRLHPAAFRERFGAEMISIFEQSDRGARWIADAGISLIRQWFLRTDFRKSAVSAGANLAESPMFLLLDEQPGLPARNWLRGFAVSSLSFLAASMLLSHGNGGTFIIGSHRSSSSGWQIQVASSTRHLDSEVDATLASTLDTFAGRAMVQRVYRSIRVLGALDTNHDLVLSPTEIANAPASLYGLDRNHDGALEAAECIRLMPSPWPGEANPMRSNPALAALDVDHDGVISAKEIRDATSSLKRLDKDHDGYLTPEELLSPALLKQIEESLK